MSVFNYFPRASRYVSFDCVHCRMYGRKWKNRTKFTFRGVDADNINPVSLTMEVPRPLIPSADPDCLDRVFHVLHFDYMVNANMFSHKTFKFYSGNEEGLIIRRGLQFKIKITFNDKYDPEQHELALILLTGDCPTPGLKTHIRVDLDKEPFEDKLWWSKLEQNDESGVVINIHPPVDCIIGEWDLFVKTSAPKNEAVNYYLYDHNFPLYVLFNPWCEADQVYFNCPDLLRDYILNDSLTIFVGTKEQLKYKHWHAGQFDDGILDLTLYLLRKAFYIVTPLFSNPVKVIEALNRMIAYDSEAVMSLLWNQSESRSRRPTSWTSSIEIVNEYKKGLGSVKYGCCWINAALLTTFCRALGIPSRVVTSFTSNHDINSIIINQHYLTLPNSLRRLPYLTRESIWSFHVWMDAWILRPDLDNSHGWHAVEPTPQKLEYGNGVYGPTPISSIRLGSIGIGDDVNMFLSEINAKVSNYVRFADDWSIFQVNKDVVGNFICTAVPLGKPVCSKEPADIRCLYQDLTQEYKSSSVTEKLTELLPDEQELLLQPESCIKVEFQDNYDCTIGENQIIKFDLKNQTDECIKVDFVAEVQAVDYTGCEHLTLFEENYFDVNISVELHQSRSITIRPEKYIPLLQRGLPYRFTMKIMVYGSIKGSDKKFTWTKLLTPLWPNLTIMCPEKMSLQEAIPLKLILKNPLPVPLTHCEIIIDGTGLTHIFRGSVYDIPDFSEFAATIMLEACFPGTAHIIATIHSIELQDVWSCTTINI